MSGPLTSRDERGTALAGSSDLAEQLRYVTDKVQVMKSEIIEIQNYLNNNCAVSSGDLVLAYGTPFSDDTSERVHGDGASRNLYFTPPQANKVSKSSADGPSSEHDNVKDSILELLFESIKEQTDEIVSLRTQNSQLAERVAALETRMAAPAASPAELAVPEVQELSERLSRLEDRSKHYFDLLKADLRRCVEEVEELIDAQEASSTRIDRLEEVGQLQSQTASSAEPFDIKLIKKVAATELDSKIAELTAALGQDSASATRTSAASRETSPDAQRSSRQRPTTDLTDDVLARERQWTTELVQRTIEESVAVLRDDLFHALNEATREQRATLETMRQLVADLSVS